MLQYNKIFVTRLIYIQKVQFFDSVFAGLDDIFSLSGTEKTQAHFLRAFQNCLWIFVAQIGPELAGGGAERPSPVKKY